MIVSLFYNIVIFALLVAKAQVSRDEVPTSSRDAIKQDLKELSEALNQTETMDYGRFCFTASSTRIVVYIHRTQVKCSSVGIKEWDKIGTINKVPTRVIHPSVTPMLDLEPFCMDNNALALRRKDDKLLLDIYSGKVQANDAGKYSWCISQSMVDWEEETWTTQLFHCLKEHEQDLKVQIVNISQRGPKWAEWLQTIFFSPL